MFRRTLTKCLIDDPGAWSRGMLHLKDELLLTDWKSEAFDAYSGCDEQWSVDQGYLRFFQLKGAQKRLYGQFAMKAPKAKTYRWQPAILDTGASGVYLCQRTLASLAIDPLKVLPITVMIGKHTVSDVRITEDQGKTTDGSDLSGDVNILGMQFLGEGLVETMEKLVHQRIGHPSSTIEVVVRGQGLTFAVTPKHPFAWSLKQAIQPTWRPVEAAKIIIKSPDGKMLNEEPLQAGVDYVFDLPPSN